MHICRKRLSLQDREKIEELIRQGKSQTAISREISFSVAAVQREVSKFPNHKEYNARLADSMIIPPFRKSHNFPVLEKLKHLEITEKHNAIEERISAVEFQIEIILDKIKEMLNDNKKD